MLRGRIFFDNSILKQKFRLRKHSYLLKQGSDFIKAHFLCSFKRIFYQKTPFFQKLSNTAGTASQEYDVLKKSRIWGAKNNLISCYSSSYQFFTVLMTANFKFESTENLDALLKLQPNRPILVSEFWPGWFDHWFEPIHNTLNLDGKIIFLLVHSCSKNCHYQYT